MAEKIQGAEAEIKINDKVVKTRKRKKYRHPELDERLREERTETEAHLMEEAKRYNVNVPEIEKAENYTLEMDKIEGAILKEQIAEKPELSEKLGTNIAYLHSTDIIHGDLTTSNAIVTKKDKIFMIDFGLSFRSERIEDKAVDIHLFKQVLESSHPKIAEEAWEEFKQGYREYEKSEKVLEQLEEVDSRGRYK